MGCLRWAVCCCRNLHGLWRWGWPPGTQGAPGNTALGGWGRPPGHPGVWSVAPTKSEQPLSLHQQPACKNAPRMPWPAMGPKEQHSSWTNALQQMLSPPATQSLCLSQSADYGMGPVALQSGISQAAPQKQCGGQGPRASPRHHACMHGFHQTRFHQMKAIPNLALWGRD